MQQLLNPGKFPEAAVELQRYEQGNHADRHPRESRMQCRQKAAVAHECVDAEVESRQQRQQACQIQQHDVEQHQACDADDELPVDFGFALFHRLSHFCPFLPFPGRTARRWKIACLHQRRRGHSAQ